MNNIFNNLIEYSGVSPYIPKNIQCYKEVTLDSNVALKLKDKSFREIVKVSATAKIINHRVVSTPRGKSLEGQVLSGKKSIIEGRLLLRIDYLSDFGNKVYCLMHTVDFCSTLILNDLYLNKLNLISSVFIENIHAEVVNDKEIFVITTLLTAIET